MLIAYLAYVLSPGWAVRGCWPSRPPHPAPCSPSRPQGKAECPELSTCLRDPAGCLMGIYGSPLQTHPEASKAITKDKKKERKEIFEHSMFIVILHEHNEVYKQVHSEY